MIELTLPFPPAANNLFGNSRRGRFITPRYRKWRTEAEARIMAQQWSPLIGHYSMSITVDRPDKRRRDISNLSKAIEDSLVTCGVIEDDSLCDRITLQWSGQVAKPALARVLIEPSKDILET